MNIFRILFLTFLLHACSQPNAKPEFNYTLNWNDLPSNYSIRFFRAEQFGKQRIDYLLRTCSDFIEMKEGWTELTKAEIYQLKSIITDTANWEKEPQEFSKRDYLYAGFVVYSENNELIGKIDLTEATNRFIFFPKNPLSNEGRFNCQGALAFYDLFEALEKRVN